MLNQINLEKIQNTDKLSYDKTDLCKLITINFPIVLSNIITDYSYTRNFFVIDSLDNNKILSIFIYENKKIQIIATQIQIYDLFSGQILMTIDPPIKISKKQFYIILVCYYNIMILYLESKDASCNNYFITFNFVIEKLEIINLNHSSLCQYFLLNYDTTLITQRLSIESIKTEAIDIIDQDNIMLLI